MSIAPCFTLGKDNYCPSCHRSILELNVDSKYSLALQASRPLLEAMQVGLPFDTRNVLAVVSLPCCNEPSLEQANEQTCPHEPGWLRGRTPSLSFPSLSLQSSSRGQPAAMSSLLYHCLAGEGGSSPASSKQQLRCGSGRPHGGHACLPQGMCHSLAHGDVHDPKLLLQPVVFPCRLALWLDLSTSYSAPPILSTI